MTQIDEVKVWNRTDCCEGRLSDFYVLVSNTVNPEPGDGGIFELLVSATPSPQLTVAVGTTGRYVRIYKVTGVLSLAEVQVLGPGPAAVTPTPTPDVPQANLAMGQPAMQSSEKFGAGAARAVDGDTDGDFTNGSVTHTFPDTPSWWEVDLGSVVQINKVRVWNRTDCCQARLSDFYVLVSDTANPEPGDLGIFEQFIASAQNPMTVISVGTTGRYVRIFKLSGVLSLAEVEVTGPVPGGTPTAQPSQTPTPTVMPVNLAQGQPATQSSEKFGAAPERAVDGDSNGDFAGGSVTHTFPDTPAWWEVDLGSVLAIDDVRLWNRTDCCQTRLSDFFVLVSDTANPEPGDGGIFEQFVAAAPSPVTTIAVGVTGRYVRIYIASGIVSLAEVEVLGPAP